MRNILRAGLWERVSTEEQAKFGYSIKTQVDALEEYSQTNKMKIVDHYCDEGVSAGKPYQKRPEMVRLLADVKAGKIDIIIFTKLDRWFRNVKEYFKVQEILDKHKVEWRAIWEDYDTTTANGRMAITIFLAIAENEREKTAERVIAVLRNKRNNKEACFGGNAIPLGYMKEKDEDGLMRLVKDPKTEDAMQDFWDILIEYNNLNKAIRHMINYYGIKRDPKSWGRISRSEFYCGIHRGVIDFCEPYVSPEDFLKFQETRPVKATPSGRTYLFKGLIRCPECNHKLCGDADTRKKVKTYKSYRCRNRCKGCSYGASISETKIEKQLLEDLERYIKNEIALIEIEAAKPKAKPKTNINKLKEQRRRLEVIYLAGNKTDDEYIREDAELKLLIEKAELDAPPKEKDLSGLKKLLETDFRTIYRKLNEEEKQAFWLRLIKEIIMEDKVIKRIKFF